MSLFGFLKGFLSATTDGIDSMTLSYLEAALSSSSLAPDLRYPGTKIFSASDFSQDTVTRAVNDCAAFASANSDLISKIGMDAERLGEFFWYARNEDLARGPTPLKSLLISKARAFGEAIVVDTASGLRIFIPSRA